MKAKHILFISSWYPNRNNPAHGIFNRYFAEAAALYNDVSVLHVCSDINLKTDVEIVQQKEDNIRTVTVYYRKVTSSLPVISALQKRKKVLRAFQTGYDTLFQNTDKPDLIHLNVVMPLGIGAYFLSKKFNIPFVVNENWSGYTKEDGNYKGLLIKRVTKQIISRARAILPTSEWLKKAMLEHGLTGNYHVIPNVVNAKKFTISHERSSDDQIRLVHISSLNDREKNVSGILRAFSLALKHKPGMRLTIVGSGVDEQVYKQLCAQLQIQDDVVFAGRLMSDKLVECIQSHDALIMFSNYETFSLVNIEAFACGKPVITSDAGAIPEYMLPDLGYMVKKKDENALMEAILSFSNNKKKFKSESIRDYAIKNFSYEKVGKDLNGIYEKVLKKDSD